MNAAECQAFSWRKLKSVLVYGPLLVIMTWNCLWRLPCSHYGRKNWWPVSIDLWTNSWLAVSFFFNCRNPIQVFERRWRPFSIREHWFQGSWQVLVDCDFGANKGAYSRLLQSGSFLEARTCDTAFPTERPYQQHCKPLYQKCSAKSLALHCTCGGWSFLGFFACVNCEPSHFVDMGSIKSEKVLGFSAEIHYRRAFVLNCLLERAISLWPCRWDC